MINIKENYYKAGIYTLGCRVNRCESDAIADKFRERGFTVVDFSERCDVYVINTCSVTAESDRKSRQMIRRAHNNNPGAYIIVTGCFSQTSPNNAARIEGVDFICGNKNKLGVVDKAVELLRGGSKKPAPELDVGNLIDAGFEPISVNTPGSTRAFIKIQDGCDNGCAYCVIPLARGRNRSKPPSDVINEVRSLAEKGYAEVVLTGIETASYGLDLDSFRLDSLLREINKIEGIQRIRLGSLDPAALKPSFTDNISSLEKVMPHFHLSLQSGSDEVLRIMKRRYNMSMVFKYIDYMKEKLPDALFTADVITGFPGETEDDFDQTVEAVKKLRLYHMHIFPYSRRPGTAAASMENQVEESVKKERAARLDEIGLDIKMSIVNDYIASSRVFPVLFETYENGSAKGHTPNFMEVRTESSRDLRGHIAGIKLQSFDGAEITGILS